MSRRDAEGPIRDLHHRMGSLTATSGEQRNLLEAAIAQAGEAVMITTAELEQPGPRIVYVNEAFTRITGYPADECIGRTPRMLQGAETDRDLLDRLKVELREHGWFEGETWNYRKDGGRYRVRWTIAPVSGPTGGARYFVSVQRDVTELHTLREHARQETQRLDAILQSVAEAILTMDDRGHIQSVNPACEDLFRCRAEQLVGTPVATLIPDAPETPSAWCTPRKRGAGTSLASAGGCETEAVRADGTRFPVAITITDTGLDDAGRFVGALHDLTERRRIEQERLHYHANFNARTGLPNRKYTLQLLDAAIHRAARLGQHVAVVVVEIRNFGSITQGLGEEAGNQLLDAMSHALRKQLADQSHFLGVGARGRMIVVLERLARAEHNLMPLLQEVLTGIERDLSAHAGRTPMATICAGTALYPSDSRDADGLLGQAEAALGHALASGASTIKSADAEANARLREQLSLQADLRDAVARGELYLAYQPQAELTSGRILGAEALLRWEHPDRGTISPGVFIPMLEDSGLIDSVGRWVLAEAAQQAHAWLDRGHALRVAINLSPRQVHASSLVDPVAQILRETRLPPHLLELEITESLLLDLQPATQSVFEQLAEMGIQLALDDFGTGYSALAYLQALPLQTLKIDRTFVGGIGTSRKSEELVRGIVNLSGGLGLSTVAEGIETPTQQRFLQELGCKRGQGFGLGRPMRAEQLTCLLESPSEGPN